MSRHMFARTGSAKNVTIHHEDTISRYAYSALTGDGESVTVVMGYDQRDRRCFCYVLFDADGMDQPLYASDDHKAGRECQDATYYRPFLASLGVHPPEVIFSEIAADRSYGGPATAFAPQ